MYYSFYISNSQYLKALSKLLKILPLSLKCRRSKDIGNLLDKENEKLHYQ